MEEGSASLHYTVCVHILCIDDYVRLVMMHFVCVSVSKQQKSETEADVKQLTLGLHVFAAV